MMEKIQKMVASKKTQFFLSQYGIELKHFLPGRVRIGIPNWRTQEEKLYNLINELRADPDITSVEFTETSGTALIYFNKDAMLQNEAQHRLLTIIKKYA